MADVIPPTARHRIGPVTWSRDGYGPYWWAERLDGSTGRLRGLVGSFFDVDETGMRPTREEQEAELEILRGGME